MVLFIFTISIFQFTLKMAYFEDKFTFGLNTLFKIAKFVLDAGINTWSHADINILISIVYHGIEVLTLIKF